MTRAAKPSRIRLDQLLVERGLAESRARARALVMAGRVYRGWSARRPSAVDTGRYQLPWE